MVSCCLLLWMQNANAQLAGWQYASVIEISEHQGNSYTDEQVLITLNTQDLIANLQMQVTGADMRFSTDCDGSNLLYYYLESGINTSATKVWVRVPSILPFAVTKIYFFSGNQLAAPGSDFSNTFPVALTITAPTVTNLFGTLNYDWFEIQAGATVNVPAGNVLDIASNKIKIGGVLNATGAGDSGGVAGGGMGSGAGGGTGTVTVNDGAGGGGHGGLGGDGGYDIVVYAGGTSYGTATSMSAASGSGGGGGIAEAGGNGGGSVSLGGIDIEITGSISVDGTDGNADTVNSQGTGGGSGGSALAVGRFISVTGSVSAKGGNGGADTSALFGGGGGGAGGRIKAFYQNTATLSGLTDVSGGTGGCCGTVASENGDPGTVYTEKLPDIYSTTVSPMILRQSPVIAGDTVACVLSSEIYMASVVGGSTYFWGAMGGTVESGQGTNTAAIKWTASGNDTVFLVTTNLFLGCSDTAKFPVFVSGNVPSADFTFGTACESAPVSFTDASTIGAGSIVSFAWNFGNGNNSQSQNPQQTYSAGTYNLLLEVTSDMGCTDTVSKNVIVESYEDAGFTATTACQGDTTFFTPNSLTAFTYSWNFGDGNTSAFVSPSNPYVSPDNYLVTLQVTTPGGCLSSATNSVAVNPLPIVDFSFVSACPNANVQFSNLTAGALSYSWDFGDGNTSSASDPAHAYTTAGTYTVNLVATSASGCSDSIAKQVTVYDMPTASFTSDTVCTGTATTFSNTSTVASGFLTYTWNFGDGSLPSNALNPTHSYSAGGVYSVSLSVISNNGCAASANGNALVNSQPAASFTANPDNVCIGAPITFTNTSSVGPGISYFWNFDDGNASTDTSPVYTYGLFGTFNVTLDVTSPDGCVAQAQQTVSVFANPVASFTAPDVCAGSGTQFTNTSSIAVGSMNFTWDFGDGGNSALDNPLYTYADTGTYSVTLTAVSENGCSSVASEDVTVRLQPNADYQILEGCFGSNITILDISNSFDAGAYYQVDLFNDGIYDNGPFPAGDTAVINVGFTGSVLTRIRLTNSSGCMDSVVETMTVNAFPVAGFTSTDACFGGPVTFTNTTSSVDPNLLGSVAYQWDLGDGTTTTDINPVHTYDSSGIFTVTLTAVSVSGCSDTFSNTLIVYPLPVADFTHGVACFDKDVVFTNTSSIPFGTMTHHWEFGDNTTADTLSPTHKYTSIGVYQITLTSTSDAGCVSAVTKDITVYPNPTANFVATEVCEGNATEFTNLSSISSGAFTFEWDFGDSFNSIDEDPAHTYGSDGDYDVVLEITSDFGCTDTENRTVTVFAKPDVSFTASNVCDGGTVVFTNTTTVPSGNVLFNIWNFGDGTNSFDDNPSHQYATYGTYSVKLFVQSEEGCSDSLLQAVIVFRQPTLLITHNGPLAFCDGGDVTLAALPFPITNSYSYQWSTNDADSSIVVTASGTYCVTATDQNGCAADTCETVTVWTNPVVTALTDKDSISKGYFAQLTATGGTTYQWSASPPDATLSPNVQSPAVSPLVTTTYTVTATDANGCTGTATVTVTVVDDYFVHPTNVITPNGDAYNQNWFVENILSYPDNEVLIFDRWGTLVYQQKAYDNSWEGTHDGKDLPQGTYYYVIKFDGHERVYKGSVSIVR